MRRTLADLVHALLLLLAVGIGAWLSLAWAWRVDLSHGARASLSRSRALMRGHWWRGVTVLTVPLL